jgi:hypothetical protein
MEHKQYVPVKFLQTELVVMPGYKIRNINEQ